MKPRANVTPFENFQKQNDEKKVHVSPNISRLHWSDEVLCNRHKRAAIESPLKRWWLDENKDRIYSDLRKDKFKVEEK